jgi:prepilin signal peptidase PulO-like enzyme (type II secretory pathway)
MSWISLDMLQIGLKVMWAVFAFAFGASAGSLINVLVYRLPRGLDVVWTGSRCPACETKLTWRENIPVFGWLFLRGRCRFCRSKISAEYPLVEALVGGLWAAMYLVYYALPEHTILFGVDLSALRPAWVSADAFDGWPRNTWPIFIVHLFAVASLVAMTLVDAKTFTIPLVLPWAATIVAILFHTFGAWLISGNRFANFHAAPGANWALPTPGWPDHTDRSWWWVGAALGGMLGLAIGNALLYFKLIRRSFEDYPEWEREALKAQGIDPDAPHLETADEGVPVGEHVGPGVRLVLCFTISWLAFFLITGFLGQLVGPKLGYPTWSGAAIGALLGPLFAALICRFLAPPPPATPATTGTSDPEHPTSPEMWTAYPHARREMFKELIFLTPAMGLAWLGGILATHLAGPNPANIPLWLSVLCGTLMGYLLGGAVVWGIRIAGSLGFGKEAMGLGDAHLMAAVGACFGWITASLASFPLGAVVGLYGVLIAILANRKAGRAMPFGPYLAIATLLIVFGRPLVELGLTALAAVPPPGVRLP